MRRLLAAGLALALLLDQKLHGRNLVRSFVFAPFVISGAAIGVAFQFVFDPQFGQSAAEMPLDEKNRISHRGKALAALKQRLLALA